MSNDTTGFIPDWADAVEEAHEAIERRKEDIMIGYTCAWCGNGHLGVNCPLPRQRFCKDETRRLVPRFRKLVRALQERARVDGVTYNSGRLEGHSDMCVNLRAILDPEDTEYWNGDGLLARVEALQAQVKEAQKGATMIIDERLWNEQLWSMIQSLEKENESLRQELLERAEAHEDAEARYRAAKDFGQAYEDLQNDLEQF